MELELGLALPDPGHKASGKRGLGEAFGAGKQATLPLLVRADEGGGGDERRRGEDDCQVTNKRKRLLGWPPVKCAHIRRGGGGAGYVKVKMEGVAIGRKVDVSLHGSYDELRRTLDRMFPPSVANDGKPCADADQQGGRNNDQRHPYVVTYEDGEGDWLLVGDVPWEAFAKSVKRLKIQILA